MNECSSESNCRISAVAHQVAESFVNVLRDGAERLDLCAHALTFGGMFQKDNFMSKGSSINYGTNLRGEGLTSKTTVGNSRGGGLQRK